MTNQEKENELLDESLEKLKSTNIEENEIKPKENINDDIKEDIYIETYTPEQREKRERSESVESDKPEKKKTCCCHESNNSKCSKYEKSNNCTNNKNVDSLSNASTGINENVNYSKNKNNKNEPIRFFIGGIPQFITNKDIIDYFEKYGSVQNVIIAQDNKTKRNRGFAFVTMSSQANKEKILKDSHELNGKRVDVREENNTTPSDIQRKIFVGGLNYFWTKDILAKYFSSYGEIEVVQIVVDSSGRSRCFGFVVFTNEYSVAKVLKHKKHKIHDKIVEVRKAEPKKPRNALKKIHNKKYSKYQNHFMNFPYSKESMVQWANFMYSTYGVPFLFNQRYQSIQPDYYANYNANNPNPYYPPMDNLQPDFN